jgi:hypothetical protein
VFAPVTGDKQHSTNSPDSEDPHQITPLLHFKAVLLHGDVENFVRYGYLCVFSTAIKLLKRVELIPVIAGDT